MMLLDVIGLHQVINVMAYDVDVTSGMSWHKYMVVISKWWLMIPHDLLGTEFWHFMSLTWHSNLLGTLAVRRKLDFEQGTCGICKQGAWLLWMGRMGPIGTGKGIKWSCSKNAGLTHVPPHPHLSSHQVGRKCWCPRQNLREIFETRRWRRCEMRDMQPDLCTLQFFEKTNKVRNQI